MDGAVQLHHPPVPVREPGVPEVRLQHAVRVGRADVRSRDRRAGTGIQLN